MMQSTTPVWKPLLISLLQTGIFIAIWQIGYWTYESWIHSPSFNIGFGIKLRIAVWVFLVLAILSNFLHRKYPRAPHLIILCSFVIFLPVVMPGIFSAPYRSALLLSDALFCFYSYFLWRRMPPIRSGAID